MDKYIILSPEAKGSFNDRLNFLYLKLGNFLDTEKLENRTLQYCKVFLSDAQNQIKELEEFKGKELTSHQCYIELNSIGNKLLKEADDEEYESNKKLNNLIDRFDDNECDLKGVLKYYNDNAVEINNYRHKFPSNIVGFFLHYKELDIYKIEKRESFAILSK